MLAFAIFAVTIVVVLLVAVFYLYPGSRQRPTTIPGPDPSDPKEGNLPDVNLAGGLHNFLSDLHAQHGPIASYWHGTQLVASVASPEGLSEQTHIFDRPGVLFEFLKPMIGENSLQFTNGAEGRARRKLYDSAFSYDACEAVYSPLMQLATEMCEKWASLPKEQHIPLHQYMIAYALKAILISHFGSYFKDDSKILKFCHNYDVCMAELLSRQAGPVPEENDPREKRFQDSLKLLRDTVRCALDDDKSGSTESNSFIDILNSSDFSLDVKESDALTYLVGGFHTTGNLLTWAFYYLSLYPETQEKLFEELKYVLGEEAFQPHHMKSLKYMRQVLDETMRCGVVAPYAARVQIDSEHTLCGHTVPRGTPAIQALGVIFQREDIWPNPDRFDPERFIEAENAQRHPMAFQPFGFAGRRKCPGYRLAYLEATLVVAEVIRRFKINLVEGQEVVRDFSDPFLFINPCFPSMCRFGLLCS